MLAKRTFRDFTSSPLENSEAADGPADLAGLSPGTCRQTAFVAATSPFAHSSPAPLKRQRSVYDQAMDSPPSSPPRGEVAAYVGGKEAASESLSFNENWLAPGADSASQVPLHAQQHGFLAASPLQQEHEQQQQQQQQELQQQQQQQQQQEELQRTPKNVAARPRRANTPASAPAVSAFARCATPADVDRINLHSLAPSRRAARRRSKAPADLKEKMFTYAQVKEIVRRALEQRESELVAEYDATLQERLAEQFQNFTRYTTNEVARQYKDSDFSYLS